jgi:hypothetical protein
MGQPIIILDSLKPCEDLLENYPAIYSGRPVLQFAGEMYAVRFVPTRQLSDVFT